MSEYFPAPRPLGGNVKVELDFSNYATKADSENPTGKTDTAKIPKNVDLARLKSEIDKLDIGKLETTPVDLSKLSDVVKNQVVKRTVFDKLLKKVNAIHGSNAGSLVKKADHSTKIAETGKKII